MVTIPKTVVTYIIYANVHKQISPLTSLLSSPGGGGTLCFWGGNMLTPGGSGPRGSKTTDRKFTSHKTSWVRLLQ